MFSTRNGLLIVARADIPDRAVQDYARYLSEAERKLGKKGGEKKRLDALQERAAQAGLPLE